MKERKEDASEMSTRIAIGVLLACMVCFMLFFYQQAPWSDLFLVLFTLFTWLAVREYCHLVEAKGEKPDRLWSYAVAIAYPLIHGAVVRGGVPEEVGILFWWVAFLSLSCLALGLKRNLASIALTFFGFCYIVLGLGEMLTIAYTPIREDDLRLWLFYGIGITKLTDVGALFIGRCCGRQPLAPQLSPKKTWEGAIGGIAVGLLWSLSFAFLHHTYALNISLTYLEALFLGILLPVLGQLGDMVESLFKRDAGVKDSGVLPGLGGILDLIDSLLFTIPILACFLRLREVL